MRSPFLPTLLNWGTLGLAMQEHPSFIALVSLYEHIFIACTGKAALTETLRSILITNNFGATFLRALLLAIGWWQPYSRLRDIRALFQAARSFDTQLFITQLTEALSKEGFPVKELDDDARLNLISGMSSVLNEDAMLRLLDEFSYSCRQLECKL